MPMINWSNLFPIYIHLVAVIAWVGGFSLVGTIMVMKDKQMARQGRRRIPEKRLMWMGALGGALLMWMSMLLVHHKTRRNKFMIGFPIMALIHITLFALVWKNREVFIFMW